MTNPNIFSTSDLSLSTALMCLNYPITSVIKKGTKGYFEFENTVDLQKDIQHYFASELQVEPMKLFNILKTLKTRLYNSDIC